MLKLKNYPVSKQIASWLYLDGHPVAEPVKTRPLDREFIRELIAKMGRN